MDSTRVLRWGQEKGHAAIAWHSISNCAYILHDRGRHFLSGLLKIVEVAPVGTEEARQSLAYAMSDLEDAMQAAAAISWGADYIITRNLRDYRFSPVPAISPSDLVKRES